MPFPSPSRAAVALTLALALGGPPAVTDLPAGGGRTADRAADPPADRGAGQPAAAAGRGAAWAWPLGPPRSVLRRFDPPRQRWGAGHRGVDLRAAGGQPVLAPADGVVSFAGDVAGRGVVVVAHQGGLRSTFEPVVSTLPVGTVVTRGQQVGSVADAAGHCAPTRCLHWGVLRGDAYLDPLALVGAAPVVLLPLTP